LRATFALMFALVSMGMVTQASAAEIKVVMDQKKPNGQAWDALGGKPDPYIVVDGKSYKSSFCKNAFTCTFDVSVSGAVSVEVWDKDALKDDSAGTTVCTKGKGCATHAGAFVYIQ
jgi:hypothetical protein